MNTLYIHRQGKLWMVICHGFSNLKKSSFVRQSYQREKNHYVQCTFSCLFVGDKKFTCAPSMVVNKAPDKYQFSNYERRVMLGPPGAAAGGRGHGGSAAASGSARV